jgi:mannobiose 2-epimerase
MKFFFRKGLVFFSILFLIAFLFSFSFSSSSKKSTKEELSSSEEPLVTNKDSLISELHRTLDGEFYLFYPLCIDTVYGGYFSDANYKWELSGLQNKMIVTQARHVWSNANASIFFRTKEPYFKYAEHGFKFLKNIMWDKKYGGFYNLVDRKGIPIKENGALIKQAYGDAFAIYGLAAYYKAFGDTSALALAKKTFFWLDKHSYDPKYGGYFQFMKQDGTPYKNGFMGVPPKDQNSSIHILECLTELYGVWKNPLLKERLNSLLLIVRDKMIKDKDYLQLFFNRDLTPVSYRDSSEESRNKNIELDHISFGHNVETAYLMLEASNALGIKDNSETIAVGKSMDDFTLENGWDKQHGGIYDGGYLFKGEDSVKIIMNKKEWWSQVEALNSFLLMSRLFPNDKMNYYEKFLIQWNYIKKYLLDHKYGGFFWDSIDTAPQAEFSPKSSIWKCNYHTSRALINCIERLNEK